MLPNTYLQYCIDYAIELLIANHGLTSEEAHTKLNKKISQHTDEKYICDHIEDFVKEIVNEK